MIAVSGWNGKVMCLNLIVVGDLAIAWSLGRETLKDGPARGWIISLPLAPKLGELWLRVDELGS